MQSATSPTMLFFENSKKIYRFRLFFVFPVFRITPSECPEKKAGLKLNARPQPLPPASLIGWSRARVPQTP